jgi:DNA primase
VIPEDFIQTLLSRVDIVEVIDRRVPLKKAGANYVACCPFHQEKTPSFSVSPAKQFYHCFGCGAHGTAISFLMEYAGKTFPEAVEDLARDVGLAVPRVNDDFRSNASARPSSPDFAELMQRAANFYKTELKSAENAVTYLKTRGLSGEICKKFSIGYAPDDWQSLKRVFPDYDKLPLAELGLTIDKENDKGVVRRYDRFRDRIMFPILSQSGKIIGFGGRVLGKGEPKYLNSPETPLFSKGRELYGLFQARDAIRKRGLVLVVEGYMDVVALAQFGVDYCVATLGTATTAAHTQKLYRQTDNVVFCFDGDNAGRTAAWRALNNTLPVLQDGKKAAFLFLPDGLDPDDFIRERGRDAFEALLETAVPLSEYMLDHLTRLNPPTSDEGRAGFVNAALPLIAQIKAPALSALLRKRLAGMAGLPESELRVIQTEGMDAKRPPSHGDNAPAKPRPTFRIRITPSLYKDLLQAILQQPQLAITHDIPEVNDGTPEAQALYDAYHYCRSLEKIPSTAALIQHFADTQHERLIARLLNANNALDLSDESMEAQYLSALNRMEDRFETERLNALLARPFGELSADERAFLSKNLGKIPRVKPETPTTAEKPAPVTHTPPPRPAHTKPAHHKPVHAKPVHAKPAPAKPAATPPVKPATTPPELDNPFDEEPPPF